MFIPGDIYTSSGANDLYGCWTSDVTKYDPSSFYNWEEDNLPLYDLEERTHLLWERQGHPTSSLTGFAFLVSSNVTDACNGRIFSTLSACLDKLPDSINAPYLIEVAAFGNLGELSISNKTFGPRGSIEIINRNFGNVDGATLGGDSRGIGNMEEYSDSTYNASYGLASSVYLANTTASSFHATFPDANTLPHEFAQVSSIEFSATTCSSVLTPDARLSNNITVFSKLTNPIHRNRMSVALAATNSTVAWANPSYGRFSFTPYEFTMTDSEQRDTFDASCINEISNTEIAWKSIDQIVFDWVGALAYGNRLDRIKINNCNGPIFIRGFTTDGALAVDNGISIKNSTQVYLERCSTARNTQAGLYALNSDVTLLRGFAAYRNYSYNTNGGRGGMSWSDKINDTTNLTLSSIESGAGILGINSNITVSSNFEYDWAKYLAEYNSWSTGTKSAYTAAPNPFDSALFCLSRNSVGIKLINSVMNGGQAEVSGVDMWAYQYYNSYDITSELNTQAGVELQNSELSLDGRLNLLGNFYGIDADSSLVETDMLVCRYNQKQAVNLNNSRLIYNKSGYRCHQGGTIAATVESAVYKLHQVTFTENGGNVKLTNSIFEPVDLSGTPTFFERVVASGTHGMDHDRPRPGFQASNNSKLNLVHYAGQASNDFAASLTPSKGHQFAIENGSELILNGSNNYASLVVGPNSYANQEYKAGILVDDNSKCRISGPTLLAQYAVPILVDNGSVLEITPHKTSDGSIDVSGYSLEDPANHTMVEIHSTRAGIVANNNSVVNFQNLGDYNTQWATGTYGAVVLASSLAYDTADTGTLGTELFTSAGSLQFYPNPIDVNSYGEGGQDSVPADIYVSAAFLKNPATGFYYNLNSNVGDITNQNAFSGTTGGGMCLRALNGSKVNVRNVHFPCGHWNGSGVIYDVSGAETEALCNRTFIWNIADDSEIHAEFVSVSGLHPADAGYHGPLGVWWSSSAAPAGTPDTSTVSVLDFYGSAGPEHHDYARTTFENRGPFRLYFSVHPEANWFLTSALDFSGYIPQVYAQGYQFSGPIQLPEGSVSSFYTSTWRNNFGNISPSGFFHGSALLVSPNNVRAVLDDSASNLFANAKHCSVGKSGMGKVVTIYFPYRNTYGGESADNDQKQYGRGFRSTNVFDLESRN